jgi:hypothetical protein
MTEKAADFIPFGSYPSDRKSFLKVRLARPEYLLAMKVEALERGQARDRADIEKLCDKIGIHSLEDVLEIRSQYFNKPPSLETKLRIERAIAEMNQVKIDNVDEPPKISK